MNNFFVHLHHKKKKPTIGHKFLNAKRSVTLANAVPFNLVTNYPIGLLKQVYFIYGFFFTSCIIGSLKLYVHNICAEVRFLKYGFICWLRPCQSTSAASDLLLLGPGSSVGRALGL